MSTTATAKQTDYILRLANELTGERVGYVSQSSVLSAPRNGWTSQEASLLIEDLLAAIEAEKERAKSGAVEGARVTFGYVWKDGAQTQVTGTITGYKWDNDWRVYLLRLSELDQQSKARATDGSGSVRFAVARMTGLTVLGAESGDREALLAERSRIVARLAAIDAELGG